MHAITLSAPKVDYPEALLNWPGIRPPPQGCEVKDIKKGLKTLGCAVLCGSLHESFRPFIGMPWLALDVDISSNQENPTQSDRSLNWNKNHFRNEPKVFNPSNQPSSTRNSSTGSGRDCDSHIIKEEVLWGAGGLTLDSIIEEELGSSLLLGRDFKLRDFNTTKGLRRTFLSRLRFILTETIPSTSSYPVFFLFFFRNWFVIFKCDLELNNLSIV